MSKICSKCKKELQFSEFHRNKSKKCGYNSYCKLCTKTYHKENIDRIKCIHNKYMKEYNKKYYEDNKEKELQRHNSYYIENRDEILEKERKHRKEFPEISREYGRKYRQTENGKFYRKLAQRKRDNKLKSISHNFTYKKWKEKLDKTKGYCPNCNGYIGIENLTLDHILPISKVEKGFIYTIDDVQPLCRKCNCSKRDKV